MKIAAPADTCHRLVAPRGCSGPVVFMACVRLSLGVANALVEESMQ